MSAQARTVLDHLRRATRDDHQALDQHPVLSCLVSSGLDHASYGCALAALYPAQQALEQEAAAAIRRFKASYRFSPRAPELADDLNRLGRAPASEPTVQTLAPQSIAELIGLLYVLEGSRLGAQVIAKQVRAALGDAACLRFFSMAAGERAWPTFIRFAERHCAPSEVEVAISAARLAFGLFYHCLNSVACENDTP